MKPIGRIAIASLAGAFGIWATCSLGFWQLHRAAAKARLQQVVGEAASAVPTPPNAEAQRDPTTLIHRHLRLRGRWLPDRVVYLDNRPQSGRAGFYVLMPLRIAEPFAADVIVNRGWTPRGIDDRARIRPFVTPAGFVNVTGVALADEPRLLDLAEPADRSLKGIWQNFDFAAYTKASGDAPLPIIVRQDRAAGVIGSRGETDDGLARDWPDQGDALQGQIDRHHGYAFQWFALAATLGALLSLQVFRVIRHGRTVLQ